MIKQVSGLINDKMNGLMALRDASGGLHVDAQTLL